MKKILLVSAFLMATLGLNAKAIDGFRATPTIGAGFATGEPDSTFAGSIGIDVGVLKDINEKSELEFGLGLSYIASLDIYQAGTEGINAVGIDGSAVKNIDGGALPIYAKIGYTYKLENSSFLTAAFKVGYAVPTSKDQNFIPQMDTVNNIVSDQEIENKGGVYLGASVGYGISNFVVSLNYEMIGSKITSRIEREKHLGMGVDYDLSSSTQSVSAVNHVFGVGLSYRLDMK